MRVTISVRVQAEGYSYNLLADDDLEVDAPQEILGSLRWSDFVASLVERALASAIAKQAAEEATE